MTMLNRPTLLAALLMLLVLVSGSSAVVPKLKPQPEDPAPPVHIAKGTVTGRIMLKSVGPLTGGQVLFFDLKDGQPPPPVPGVFERTPNFARDLDPEGGFTTELPSGKYYVGAIRRMSGHLHGPPVEGDYVFRSVDRKGKLKVYRVTDGGLLDLGDLTFEVPSKSPSP